MGMRPTGFSLYAKGMVFYHHFSHSSLKQDPSLYASGFPATFVGE